MADVLFGPEQPATSSAGSNGDRWDPWRRWLRQGREGLGSLVRRLRRSSERGWQAVSRSFPARHNGSAPPTSDIVPAPVAPPLHPERIRPRPAPFVETRPESLPDGSDRPDWSDPLGLPTPVPLRDLPEPPDLPAPLPVPVPPPPSSSDDLLPAFGSARAPGGATATLHQAAEPVTTAITIPREVRIRAGLGLLAFTMLIGAGLAMLILLMIGLGIKVLGGV